MRVFVSSYVETAQLLRTNCEPATSHALATVLDSGKARNLQFAVHVAGVPVHRFRPLCHLDRSVPGFPTSLHSTAATDATLRKERRMKPTDQAALHRKSGGAEWRDLQFVLPWRILTANTSRLGSRIVPPVVRPRKRIHHRPYEKGESRKHLLALDRMVCSIL
jgi:hypothetical protein